MNGSQVIVGGGSAEIIAFDQQAGQAEPGGLECQGDTVDTCANDDAVVGFLGRKPRVANYGVHNTLFLLGY